MEKNSAKIASSRKKVYVAGKITGLEGYKEKFKEAEELVRSMGYTPINPAIIDEELPYRDYIDIGLNKLAKCDAILLLDNWERSNGARLEEYYARVVGMPRYLMENGVMRCISVPIL